MDWQEPEGGFEQRNGSISTFTAASIHGMSIYRVCGDSQRGKSHETGDTVCQDSFFCIEKAELVVCAVADGLGSSKRSDIASKMAAKGAVEYCANSVFPGMTEQDTLSCIHKAFDKVNFDIKQKAGDCLDDYDTTLTVAVYIAGELYYGHAGDSGIVAMRSDGIFEEVTVPQLGAGVGKERPVYPLAAESHWVFEKYKHRARAIFMMTDGVLNKVIPPLLENQEYKLDHAYLFYLYDSLCKNPDIRSWVRTELESILPQEINYDDKTLVAIMCNTVKITLQPKKYYSFPSKELWDRLMAEHKAQLYGYKSGMDAGTTIAPPGPPHSRKGALRRPSAERGSGAAPRGVQGQGNQRRSSLFSRFVSVFLLGFVLGVLVTIAAVLAINSLTKPTVEASAEPPTVISPSPRPEMPNRPSSGSSIWPNQAP